MSNDIVMAYASLKVKTRNDYITAVKMIAAKTGKTEKQVKAAVTRFINSEIKDLGFKL